MNIFLIPLVAMGLLVSITLIAAPDSEIFTVASNDQQQAPKAKPKVKEKTDEIQGTGGTIHCDLCTTYCTRLVCDLNECRNESYACGTHSCNCRPGS